MSSNSGIPKWIYIGGAGLLVIILGAVLLSLPQDTPTDTTENGSIIDQLEPISPSVPITQDVLAPPHP